VNGPCANAHALLRSPAWDCRPDRRVLYQWCKQAAADTSARPGARGFPALARYPLHPRLGAEHDAWCPFALVPSWAALPVRAPTHALVALILSAAPHPPGELLVRLSCASFAAPAWPGLYRLHHGGGGPATCTPPASPFRQLSLRAPRPLVGPFGPSARGPRAVQRVDAGFACLDLSFAGFGHALALMASSLTRTALSRWSPAGSKYRPLQRSCGCGEPGLSTLHAPAMARSSITAVSCRQISLPPAYPTRHLTLAGHFTTFHVPYAGWLRLHAPGVLGLNPL